MRTAKQARRAADTTANKLPEAMRRLAELRRCIDAVSDGLVPEVRDALAFRCDQLGAALLDMEGAVGVVTPAALFE
jgi:hypothetical protein